MEKLMVERLINTFKNLRVGVFYYVLTRPQGTTSLHGIRAIAGELVQITISADRTFSTRELRVECDFTEVLDRVKSTKLVDQLQQHQADSNGKITIDPDAVFDLKTDVYLGFG